MSGPNHRRQCFATAQRIERTFGKRTNSALARKDLRSFPSAGFGNLAGIDSVLLLYTRDVKRKIDSPRAIAPPAQRRRARASKSGVVDIAQSGELFGERRDGRRRFVMPSALAYLANQIAP